MKDEQYNKYIQDQVNKNEDLHFSDIRHDKNAVWERIEGRLEKKRAIPLWFYSAAATIILLVSMGFVFNQKLNSKNIEIAQLKAQLEVQQNQLAKIETKMSQPLKQIDTVEVLKEKVVYLPVKAYKEVVKHDTINHYVVKTDTVFIKEPVKKQLLVKNEEKATIKNVEQNDIIKKEKAKNKTRRFVFLFGKPKQETNNQEMNRFVTLRSK